MIGNAVGMGHTGIMRRLAIVVMLGALVAGAQSTVPEFKAHWKIWGVDSNQEGDGSPQGAIDGERMTHWHTHWSNGDSPAHPHEISVDMGKSVGLVGFTYLPRQAKNNGQPNGRIDRFEFQVSSDGTNWSQAVRGRFSESGEWQTNRFPHEVSGRYFKLVSWSSFKGQPWAAVGELDVLVSDKDAAKLRKAP